MKRINEIIQYLERELRYNSGPAIPYVKVGSGDLRVLLNLVKEKTDKAEELVSKLEHELRYNSSPAIPYVKVGTSDLHALLTFVKNHAEAIKEETNASNEQSKKELLDELLEMYDVYRKNH